MLGKDAMKNIYLRLAVIGGVVALGATAIGQSMMATREAAEANLSNAGQEDDPPVQTPPVTTPFPASKVVLAGGEEPTANNAVPPSAETSGQAPASRFRFNAPPVDGSAPPTSATTDESAPSRFSRFPAPKTEQSAASTVAPQPSSTEAESDPSSPSANRFSGGYGRFSAMANPASGESPTANPANPAAASSENSGAPSLPKSSSFSQTPPVPAAASGSNPVSRFQIGDNSVESATEAISSAASTVISGSDDAAEVARSTVDSAASRFSSTVKEGATEVADMANSAIQGQTNPVQPAPSPVQPAPIPATPQPSVSSFNSQPEVAEPPASRFGPTAEPSVVGTPMPSSPPPSSVPAEAAPTPRFSSLPPAQPQPSASSIRSTPVTAVVATPAAVGLAKLVSSKPGEKRYEGNQTPSIQLRKVAPPEIQIGKVTEFEIQVLNSGVVEAANVVVQDMIPEGTKLVSTSPEATQGASGALAWTLGNLKPQEQRSLKIELLPLSEGNIGSVASVSFSAMASATSLVTRPKLVVEQSATPTVLAGNKLSISINISNPGTGAATGIVLEENVPSNLSHPAGAELEFELGTLKPGESRQLQLVLDAKLAGRVQNILRARGDGNLNTQHALDVEVIAPQLEIALSGPKLRYLDRPAKYTVSVSNPGTAPAHEIDVVTYLPNGLKFVEANHAGRYDSSRHAVFWSLAELPPSETGTVELVALPIEPGDQKLRVEGTANAGLQAQHQSSVRVEGLAAIFFEVADKADPIEVGKETTYEVTVVNQGSKEATNVQVAALLPDGMRGISADGDTRGVVKGQQIVFQPIARINPKQSAKLKIQVQGIAAGDQRIRVQVSTDGISNPITKEESTTVYTDK